MSERVRRSGGRGKEKSVWAWLAYLALQISFYSAKKKEKGLCFSLPFSLAFVGGSRKGALPPPGVSALPDMLPALLAHSLI